MRLTTRLRTAPGVWLAPLMVVAFIMVVNDTAGEPYWLAQVAGDAGRTMVVNALCALAGALEGHRPQNRRSEVEPSQVMVACPARPDSDLGRNDHCALRRLHGQTRIRPAHAGVVHPRCDRAVDLGMDRGRYRAGIVVARGRGGSHRPGNTLGVGDFPAWDVDLLAPASHGFLDWVLYDHPDTESPRHHGNAAC